MLNVCLVFIEPKQTPSKGLRVQGQARLYVAAWRDKDIGGVSQDDAGEALLLLLLNVLMLSAIIWKQLKPTIVARKRAMDQWKDIIALAKKKSSKHCNGDSGH
jgi:hypothetical protein